MFLILEGCAGWVAVDYSNVIYTVIALLILVLWRVVYKLRMVTIPRKYCLFLLCLWMVYLISSRFELFGSAAFVFRILAISTPLFIAPPEQSDLLWKVNKTFVILVSLAIAFHLFKLLGILPSVPTIQRGHYYYQNYFFYLYSPNYEYKCCGFCYEPGFFSLLLSVLLFINKYNFRRKCVKIYMVALLMTLSLGGYVITTVCWFLYYMTHRKGNIGFYLVKIFVVLFFFSVCHLFVTKIWNNGNNVINENIITKATDVGGTGMSFETRQSMDAILLWTDFLNSNSILFGYGYKKYHEIRSNSDYYDAASVAEFIIVNGFVGTILYVFAIGYYLLNRKKTNYATIGFVLLLLDFIQHGYGIESSMFLLVALWITYIEKIGDNRLTIQKKVIVVS